MGNFSLPCPAQVARRGAHLTALYSVVRQYVMKYRHVSHLYCPSVLVANLVSKCSGWLPSLGELNSSITCW